MADRAAFDGQQNIGALCTDLWSDNDRAQQVAMVWVDPNMSTTRYSFADLYANSNKIANVLVELGIEPGEVVALYLPKCPELFFALLGALKAQAIVNTLFANLGENALRERLDDSRSRVVFTRRSLLRRLLAIRAGLPSLDHVIVVDGDDEAGILGYRRLAASAASSFHTAPTPRATPSFLHYTSGTTGKPKGVLHVHGSAEHQCRTAREVLGLRDGDVYWCTADQAWVTGTTYGVIAPWSLGITQVHFGGPYDLVAWCRILQRERVNVWYTAPTALRMLMRESTEAFAQFDLSSLRHICSVGEPLNPEVITWAARVLGKTIYDTWFQTETGAIAIANRPGLEIRPGSMGIPVTGVEAAILRDDGSNASDGETGRLCLKVGWPSMFVAYLNAQSEYEAKFENDYYQTGDMAYRDADGYYWFQGRSDDVVNTAGHLVSPFEVESALLELPEVAESGVVGAPDPLLFEKVVAFVALRAPLQPSRELELKLRLHVSNRVSSVATPQDVVFVRDLPKNNAGKIMRRILRAQYLNAKIGDTSTVKS